MCNQELLAFLKNGSVGTVANFDVDDGAKVCGKFFGIY